MKFTISGETPTNSNDIINQITPALTPEQQCILSLANSLTLMRMLQSRSVVLPLILETIEPYTAQTPPSIRHIHAAQNQVILEQTQELQRKCNSGALIWTDLTAIHFPDMDAALLQQKTCELHAAFLELSSDLALQEVAQTSNFAAYRGFTDSMLIHLKSMEEHSTPELVTFLTTLLEKEQKVWKEAKRLNEWATKNPSSQITPGMRSDYDQYLIEILQAVMVYFGITEDQLRQKKVTDKTETHA